MRNPPAAALLFDVDGTLVDTRGAGRAAFEAAMSAWLGHPVDMRELDPSGRTDLEILFAMARREGTPPPDAGAIRAVFDAYLSALPEQLAQHPLGHACAGIPALLAALDGDSRWIVGLLTGNVARVAALKMRHYGLERHFAHTTDGAGGIAAAMSRPTQVTKGSPATRDLESAQPPAIWGAYGDDAEDRRDLVPVALQRLRACFGLEVEPSRTVIIGDTERDIECARAAGAKVLAVATGRRSAAALEAGKPDVVLPDFTDTTATLATLRRLAGIPG